MGSKTANIVEIPILGIDSHLSEAEVSQRIEIYIANLRDSETLEPPLNNLLGFFRLAQNAIKSREVSDNVPEGKRLLVLANDPPEVVDTEAITFFLDKRSPGQFNQGTMGQARIKEVVPHLRSTVEHPEHIGEKLVTMGRMFDNYIVFNVYARDDYTALQRVLWLENVMDSFRWYFRVHGISRVLELGVGDKEHVEVNELTLTKYPLTYFVRTEDIYQFGSQELKSIELNVDLATE